MTNEKPNTDLIYMNSYEQTPKYTIKEVAEITGVSAHTLRYYDKVKLFPFLERNENNIRVFSKADIEWVHLIDCLRKTKMSISEIKHYVELNVIGDSTIEQRYEILCQQEDALIKQLDDIKQGLESIRYKKNLYKYQIEQNKQS